MNNMLENHLYISPRNREGDVLTSFLSSILALPPFELIKSFLIALFILLKLVVSLVSSTNGFFYKTLVSLRAPPICLTTLPNPIPHNTTRSFQTFRYFTTTITTKLGITVHNNQIVFHPKTATYLLIFTFTCCIFF